jgi:hypothetical protein
MHKFHSPFLRLARLATQQSRLAELELLAARQAEAEVDLARQTLLDEQAAWDQEVATADPMLAPLETRLAGLAARENIRALLEWVEQERRRRAALTTEALTRWQQRRQHQAALDHVLARDKRDYQADLNHHRQLELEDGQLMRNFTDHAQNTPTS